MLAGDHLKAACDLGVPLVAVGLFYRNGYFRQQLTASGEQRETFDALDPAALPMRRATARTARPSASACSCPAPCCTPPSGRSTSAACRSTCSTPTCRRTARPSAAVTDRLYGGDREHRLRQEILLGIGGAEGAAPPSAPSPRCSTPTRATPASSASSGCGCWSRSRASTPPAALEAVRAATVFTTHTPVPAGIDRFPRDLVAQYFGAGRRAVAACRSTLLLGLGAEPGGDPAVFNMAALGMRLAARVNGVSRLHGEVAREMFAGLLPGLPAGRGADRAHHERRPRRDLDVGPSSTAALPRAPRRRLRPAEHGYAALAESSDDELGGLATRPARGWWPMCGGGCARRGRRAGSATASSRWSTACSTRTR